MLNNVVILKKLKGHLASYNLSNKYVTKSENIALKRYSIIRITSPIGISETNQHRSSPWTVMYPKLNFSSNISKYHFLFFPMVLMGCLHILGNKTNKKGNIKRGMSQVQKDTIWLMVESSIYLGSGIGVKLFNSHYKENTFLWRFLQNLLNKSVCFLFIVEVDSGGGCSKVFVEIFF